MKEVYLILYLNYSQFASKFFTLFKYLYRFNSFVINNISIYYFSGIRFTPPKDYEQIG